MRAEFKRLIGLNPCEFVDVVPDGVNVVFAGWVFVWKVDRNGNIVKPKARLVTRGFSQVNTLDFLETYAPTPTRPSSVKLLVAIVVKNDWELGHLDLNQAFIQVDLNFTVFTKLHGGCGHKSGKVMKLKKDSVWSEASRPSLGNVPR